MQEVLFQEYRISPVKIPQRRALGDTSTLTPTWQALLSRIRLYSARMAARLLVNLFSELDA